MSTHSLSLSLPCEGCLVTGLAFRGNPKDGEVHIQTADNPITIIPSHRFEVIFDTAGSFRVSLIGRDDVNFEQRTHWPKGHSVRLTAATIIWPFSPEDWKEEVARWGSSREWQITATVDLRVRLCDETADNANHERTT